MPSLPTEHTRALPVWQRPITLLFAMAIAMPIAFSVWSALLNNFVVEVAAFDGLDIGTLHMVREIPGFLAVGVIAVILVIREQTLAIISLILLGVATALTAYFPSMAGILTLTMLSSIGFHYYETVNQSLQLQWIDKEAAPQLLGWMVAAGAAATFVCYAALVLTWRTFDLSYAFVYMTAGLITVGIALLCWIAYPRFDAPTPQTKRLILRRRYWLYYALQFMAGARRQIFVIFAGFMMVERFGFEVHQITQLFMVTLIASMAVAPIFGRVVQHFGERNALIFEYAGLVLVFLAYGGLYWFGWGVVLAASLYI
ncbi:MAG: MFS transporter, partial [Shimia sp.]